MKGEIMRRVLVSTVMAITMLVSLAPMASAGPLEIVWCLQDSVMAGEPESPAECGGDWN